MTLPVFEFIRRFLQHVLPRGFKKVRHFGFLSTRSQKILALLQYVFSAVESEPDNKPNPKSKVPYCSICDKQMILIGIVGPGGFGQRLEISQPVLHQARAP